MTVETKGLANILHWRYATKKFDPARKIDDPTWHQIEQAVLLSPSSYGLQPWRFVVLTDPDLKKSLPEFSYNQLQVADCSHLVVICRREPIDENYLNHYIERIAELRNVAVDSLASYKEMMMGVTKMEPEKQAIWTSKQCYIALGILMTAASAMAVDNCPMEGFVAREYDRILALPEKGCRSVVLCALGYRSADDKYAGAKKVRFPDEEVFQYN